MHYPRRKNFRPVATRRSVISSLLRPFALLSCSHLVLVAASTTAGSSGGILPPPPPPPQASHGTSSEQFSGAEKADTDVTAILADEKPEEDKSQIDPLGLHSKDDTMSQVGDRNTAKRDESGSSQIPQTQNALESVESATLTVGNGQIQQQMPSYQRQQYWNYQQQQSQYENQSHQGQWDRQSETRQWATQQQQQQNNYQQKYPQYSQSYSNPQPLVRYTRPPPNQRKSASSFFNMAVRKLQTGIDSVSESLDSNKMASSVSSLTSRLSEIGDAVSSSVGLNSGRGRQIRPGQGVQNYSQQRITPRGRPQPRQEYAPPMSELYSLDNTADNQPKSTESETFNAVDESANWTGEQDKNDFQLKAPIPSLDHDDASDTDDENEESHGVGDVPDIFKMPTESSPKLNTASSMQMHDIRRRQSIRPRPAQLDTTKAQSASQSWPNSGFTRPTTDTRQRRVIDYDDYDSSSIGSKIKSAIGSVPVPNIPRMFKRSSEYDDGAWSDDESKEKAKNASNVSTRQTIQGRRASSRASAAIVPRPVLSILGKRTNLLSAAGKRRCVSIGRTQAILDAAQLSLLVFAIHEVLPIFYNALSSGEEDLRAKILSTILIVTDGWALYALCAVVLIAASNSAWIKPALRTLSSEVATEVESEAAYTQLYLRLMSSIPMKKTFPTTVVRKAGQTEAYHIASTARLHFFVTMAMSYLLLSTVAVLKPAGVAVASAVFHLIKLSAWKERPIAWNAVMQAAKSIGLDLVGSLKDLFYSELAEVRQEPLRVVVVISLLAALGVVAYLPSLERSRKAKLAGAFDDDEEEEDTITSLWSNIGSSSATRLSLLSSPRGVEGALDQFSRLRPDRAAAAGMLSTSRNTKIPKKKRSHRPSATFSAIIQPLLRDLAYLVSSSCVLLVPLVVYICVLANTSLEDNIDSIVSVKTITLDGWTSLFQMMALLCMVNIEVGRAAHYAIRATSARLHDSLTRFFGTLASVVGELQKLAESSAGSDFQAMLTASPTAGVVIRDFWTAHSTRKAWAVKGANIKCRNGEVVLVIGSGGSGKSRLLTSISEHIFAPPKSARTTTYARGLISIAGVDLLKWDRAQLQRRVGVWLHDVRTVSDYASLMTGCTLDEILEPVSDSQMSAQQRNAVVLAMKITALGSHLSKQLPSRLSTVVSANEDELKPSPLRPPSYPLSPSNWSLVLLTKVLAQLIAGNDNQQSTPNNIAKCLVGSILLLDDATSQMSEVDEAHFIAALRSTGAAVLLTSNRWATGRFADRIIVMDKGSVVECGTHTELISMGPERSLYAHHWNAMSSI